MFIILGDVLVKMDNKFQARATYQSIVDGYSPNDDGIVAEARARIAALSK
jgi:TolA-binding protein